jgi:DNA polymerase-3 subunit gamma/tau
LTSRESCKDAKEHLAEVATSQGIIFEDDAFILSLRKHGAMRDSIYFDRVVSIAELT